MNDFLAFFVGLIIGAAGGAAAMWASTKPLITIRAMRTDLEQLERRVDLLEAESNR